MAWACGGDGLRGVLELCQKVHGCEIMRRGRRCLIDKLSEEELYEDDAFTLLVVL